MPKYTARFVGRTKGAIGIVYPIVAITEGETEDAARLALYEHYDPYFTPKLTLIQDAEESA